MSSTTRERIVDQAMRLFSENGYSGTSIAKIEAAAGLTPGAGGIYHHFKSKEALLAAGIERQLARLDALRDIRRVLGPLGDIKAELTLTARYILAELDSESELLRILASEARNRPQLLTAAVEQLVSSTFTGFAAWIARARRGAAHRRAGNGDRRRRTRIAALLPPAGRRPRHPGPSRRRNARRHLGADDDHDSGQEARTQMTSRTASRAGATPSDPRLVEHEGPPAYMTLKRVALAGATAFITVNFWTGCPLLALWVGSQVVGQQTLSMGAVGVVIVVLAVLVFALAIALTWVNNVYDQLIKRPRTERRAPWLRSMRGESESHVSQRVGTTALELIVMINVYIAVIALAVWYVFFAGSPLPSG